MDLHNLHLWLAELVKFFRSRRPDDYDNEHDHDDQAKWCPKGGNGARPHALHSYHTH